MSIFFETQCLFVYLLILTKILFEIMLSRSLPRWPCNEIVSLFYIAFENVLKNKVIQFYILFQWSRLEHECFSFSFIQNSAKFWRTGNVCELRRNMTTAFDSNFSCFSALTSIPHSSTSHSSKGGWLVHDSKSKLVQIKWQLGSSNRVVTR